MAKFAAFDISRQIFFKSHLSYGVVNLMPLVPGHVLVIPRRVTPRFNDLLPEEVSDLFLSVQTISRVLEKEFKATSLTIACQDGADAGQSVAHTHIHILPRRPKDFEPLDKIYEVLDAEGASGSVPELVAKKPAKLAMDADRKPRTDKEMEDEATWLATFFPSNQPEVPVSS